MFQDSANNKSHFHPKPKSSTVRKGYVVPLKSKAVPVDHTRKCCTTRYKDGQMSINPYHFFTSCQCCHLYGLPNGPAFRISSSTLFSLEVPAEVRARKYLRNPPNNPGGWICCLVSMEVGETGNQVTRIHQSPRSLRWPCARPNNPKEGMFVCLFVDG